MIVGDQEQQVGTAGLSLDGSRRKSRRAKECQENQAE
jgi:hypothetical protein